IPCFDVILTYGGGPPVVNAYTRLGARKCVPIYNALDESTHFPGAGQARFAGALGFLGNRLPDREARVDQFFFEAARQMPEARFVLGGSGWEDRSMPGNVGYLGHVYTTDHNAFNGSSTAVLNISRESMARYGFSPATRVFEAAGAAACVISDDWEGIDQFFEPEREILVARDGMDVVRHLCELTPVRARALGTAAYQRALSHHTYTQRVIELERALTGNYRS
ncbi:MAG: glycosyltransferase, partial [Verrucomicrobiota bacterium]